MVESAHRTMPKALILAVLAFTASAEVGDEGSTDIVADRVRALSDECVTKIFARDGVLAPGMAKGVAGARNRAFWEHGSEAFAIPFEPGELEEIRDLLLALLKEDPPQWKQVRDLTLCIVQRPPSSAVQDLLHCVLAEPLAATRAECLPGHLGAIDYAVIGLANQWTSNAQSTLTKLALLPLQDAPGLLPTLGGTPLDPELKLWVSRAACGAVTRHVKREQVLPFMKAVASRYGVERGASNSQETDDEQLRSIQTFLFQAEQIAVGGDPWNGYIRLSPVDRGGTEESASTPQSSSAVSSLDVVTETRGRVDNIPPQPEVFGPLSAADVTSVGAWTLQAMRKGYVAQATDAQLALQAHAGQWGVQAQERASHTERIQACRDLERDTKAPPELRRWAGLKELVLLHQNKRYDELFEQGKAWLAANPNDTYAPSVRARLTGMLHTKPTSALTVPWDRRLSMCQGLLQPIFSGPRLYSQEVIGAYQEYYDCIVQIDSHVLLEMSEVADPDAMTEDEHRARFEKLTKYKIQTQERCLEVLREMESILKQYAQNPNVAPDSDFAPDYVEKKLTSLAREIEYREMVLATEQRTLASAGTDDSDGVVEEAVDAILDEAVNQ